jgi:hypothetical protein
MKRNFILALRFAIDFSLWAFLTYSCVWLFHAPRFALPTYIYIGGAIISFLIATCFGFDGVRALRRLADISAKNSN